MSTVTDTIDRFRAMTQLQETREFKFMASKWLEVESSLQNKIADLVQEVDFRREQGQPVNISTVMKLERYQALLAQMRVELGKYNEWSAGLISENQVISGNLGIRNSEEIIINNFTDRNKVPVSFNKLPVSAIQFMIGNASDGTPLNQLLNDSFPDTVGMITKQLIESTALGINPRETAKRMSNAMANNLQRSLTIARTEQLRVFREAGTMAAKESGIVTGWIWRAALSSVTCEGCLAADGSFHGIDEELNDHPNGRCFRQWVLKDLKPIHVQSGATWFRKLPAEEQRGILGPSKYKAWKDGAVKFSDFAQIRKSKRWGASVQPAPLKDIV